MLYLFLTSNFSSSHVIIFEMTFTQTAYNSGGFLSPPCISVFYYFKVIIDTLVLKSAMLFVVLDPSVLVPISPFLVLVGHEHFLEFQFDL